MSKDGETVRERADDYVLGLLDAADNDAVETEMETDAPLRAAVAQSRDRFLDLDLAGPAGPVSPGLWHRIDAAIGTRVAPQDGRGAEDRPASANDNRHRRWQHMAMAGLAASLVLAVALGYTVASRPQPQVIAILVDDAGTPLVLVEDFGDASARITPLSDYTAPEGRSMQVWTLPSKEMGPTSLGLLDSWHATILDGRTLPAPHEEQLYEITLEQPGGSPTGRPTGPILVKGFAKVPR